MDFMLKYTKVLQKIIIFLLLFILSLSLLVSTVNIIMTLFATAVSDPNDVFSVQSLQELFGLFLIILIGIELLDTVKAFLEEEKVHVEIVILVAIIAISRKVIVWDFSEYQSQELYSLSAMLLALAVSYAIVKGTWLKSALDLWFTGKSRKNVDVVSHGPVDHDDFEAPDKL